MSVVSHFLLTPLSLRCGRRFGNNCHRYQFRLLEGCVPHSLCALLFECGPTQMKAQRARGLHDTYELRLARMGGDCLRFKDRRQGLHLLFPSGLVRVLSPKLVRIPTLIVILWPTLGLNPTLTPRQHIHVRSHCSILMMLLYTRLVSNSVPTWSSRCCFTACHF